MRSSDGAFEPRTGLSKRERERQALDRSYRSDEFEEVNHGDTPDFVLQRHGGDPFGVEVTDLYEHEADARIHAHPAYLSDLFEGGRHMHRDDVEVLDVARVTIRDEDGNVKCTDVPAILRPTADPAVHSAAIAETVVRKNARFPAYSRAGITHVNLVIVDHWNSRPPTDGVYNATELLAPALRSALSASPFREVLLMSRACARLRRSGP